MFMVNKDTEISEQQESNMISPWSLSLFTQSIMKFLLLIMGITFCNILHFSIEDKFDLPIVPSTFFGAEYATSGSWFIVITLIFLCLTIWQWYKIRQAPYLLGTVSRKVDSKIMLFLGSAISFAYIIYILYGFLSGHSDFYGLLRILITLMVLTIGMVFVGVEGYFPKILDTKAYLLVVSAISITSIVTVISLVVTFASPTTLRLLQRDIVRAEQVNKLAHNIKRYYEQFKELPKSLDKVTIFGIIKREDLMDPQGQPYTFHPITNRSFDICTTFESDSNKIKRLMPIFNNEDPWKYNQGLQCRRYFMEKDKDGEYILKIDFKNYTQINVN